VTGGHREQALSAVKWSVSGELAELSIRFAFGIALARLLSPKDFGLVAMLTVVTQFVTSISDLGFEDALVQKRDLREAHRSSVFWLMLCTGSGLTAGLIAAAPWIAAFYGAPELRALALVLSALFVLSAIGTVPRAIVTGRLDFRIAASLRCTTATLAGLCAVTLAWLGFGAMSLAADLLFTEGVETMLYFHASAWRPRLEFRLAALRELLSFSGYRFVGQTLGLSMRLDQLLVGKFLGSGALGFYARAYNFMRFPVNYVSRSTLRVMFPSMVLMRHEPGRVRDVYLRTVGALALFTLPMCMGLLAVAEPLIVGVFGPQWRPTVPLLQVLSIAGAIQSVTTLASTLCLSLGRADLQMRLSGWERGSTLIAVLLGLRWGVSGVAIAYTLATLLSALPTLYFASRLVELRVATVLARARPVFVASVTMAALVWGLDTWVGPGMEVRVRLGLECVVGVLVYWGWLRLFRVAAYFDVLRLLQGFPGVAKRVQGIE
jgi:lipopolysaccharide exporter